MLVISVCELSAHSHIQLHIFSITIDKKDNSEFLATDPEARVRFPALQKSGRSGTGSTQPREYN
jgi:hypothetical protein